MFPTSLFKAIKKNEKQVESGDVITLEEEKDNKKWVVKVGGEQKKNVNTATLAVPRKVSQDTLPKRRRRLPPPERTSGAA